MTPPPATPATPSDAPDFLRSFGMPAATEDLLLLLDKVLSLTPADRFTVEGETALFVSTPEGQRLRSLSSLRAERPLLLRTVHKLLARARVEHGLHPETGEPMTRETRELLLLTVLHEDFKNQRRGTVLHLCSKTGATVCLHVSMLTDGELHDKLCLSMGNYPRTGKK